MLEATLAPLRTFAKYSPSEVSRMYDTTFKRTNYFLQVLLR